MRINFNTNQLQQNHTNFKSQLIILIKFMQNSFLITGKNLQEIVFLLPIIAEIKL